MIWLYGVGQFEGAVNQWTAREVSGLTVITAELEAPPALTAQSLREFHDVVCELHLDAAAFLPARFGQQFADPSQLEAALAERREELARALDLVRESEQMTLRWFGGPGAPSALAPAATAAGPGARYLAERRRAIAESENLPEAAEARRRLAPWVRSERVRRGGGDGLIGSLYQLVPRRDLERHAAELRALVAESNARIRVSGPSPNYAFAPRLEP